MAKLPNFAFGRNPALPKLSVPHKGRSQSCGSWKKVETPPSSLYPYPSPDPIVGEHRLINLTGIRTHSFVLCSSHTLHTVPKVRDRAVQWIFVVVSSYEKFTQCVISQFTPIYTKHSASIGSICSVWKTPTASECLLLGTKWTYKNLREEFLKSSSILPNYPDPQTWIGTNVCIGYRNMNR